jgi:hypothetical protein
MRTPAESRSTYVPDWVIWSRICRDPGVAVAETSFSEICWPRSVAPTTAMSS